MKKFTLTFLITLMPFLAHAESWSGTSTTYGNTTYHTFRSNGVQVIPATQQHYQHDNGAAIAGGVALGIVAGALLVKGISACVDCFRSKPTHYQQNNYYYWNQYTQQYEYYTY